jgi:hypothetical protein
MSDERKIITEKSNGSVEQENNNFFTRNKPKIIIGIVIISILIISLPIIIKITKKKPICIGKKCCESIEFCYGKGCCEENDCCEEKICESIEYCYGNECCNGKNCCEICESIEFCEDDEWKEIYLRKTLRRLKDDAVWKFGRWYHAFHRLSKECREKVLRFEGEHIKEIFDVSGSDMHMLAKHLENEDIPVGELMRFQKDVISDFRKLFGARKYDGKCTSRVKTAFKVYFNSNKSFYKHIKQGSICSRIDEWFKMHYPTIRDYIANKEDLWKDVMESEFNVVSKKMFKELSRRGIKSLTCHDAIYVKESINVPDIKDIFYQCLDLAAYWQIQLACI